MTYHERPTKHCTAVQRPCLRVGAGAWEPERSSMRIPGTSSHRDRSCSPWRRVPEHPPGRDWPAHRGRTRQCHQIDDRHLRLREPQSTEPSAWRGTQNSSVATRIFITSPPSGSPRARAIPSTIWYKRKSSTTTSWSTSATLRASLYLACH
jgi:hypothetical protein